MRIFLLILTSLFLNKWGFSQTDFRVLPADIRPFFEKSEYYTAHSKKDSALLQLRLAQLAFFKRGDLQRGLDVYANILTRAADSNIKSLYLEQEEGGQKHPVLDSFLSWSAAYHQSFKQGQLNPEMLKRYFVSNYIFFENPSFKQQLLPLLDTLRNPSDWEYYFLVYSLDAYLLDAANASPKTKDSVLIKAYDLVEKQPKLDPKQDFFYHLYPYDLLFFYSEYITSCLRTQKDYEKAISIQAKALRILEARLYVDIDWLSICYVKMAEIYYYKKDYLKALFFLEKADEVSAKLIENNGLGVYQYNRANIHFEMGEYSEAIKQAKIAYQQSIRQKNKDPLLYDPYITYKSAYFLTLSYLELGKLEAAKTHLQALYSVREMCAKYPNNLAEAQGFFFQQSAMPKQAIQTYEQGIVASEKNNASTAKLRYRLASQYLADKNYPKALQNAQSYLYSTSKHTAKGIGIDPRNNPHPDSIGSTFDALQALILKLEAYQGLGVRTHEEALHYKQTANFGIFLLNSLLKNLEREGSKNSILTLSYPLYAHAIAAAGFMHQFEPQKSYIDTAFKHMEDSKALLLTQTLAQKQAKGFAGVDEKLIEQETQLTQNVQFYTQQLRDAKNRKDLAAERLYQGYLFGFSLRLDSLKKRLDKEYPAYYQLKYNIPPISIRAVQAALNDTSLFIAYFESKGAYAAIVISHNACKLLHLPLNAEAYQRLELFNNMVQSHQIKKTPADFARIGSQLYDLLLREALTDTKTFPNLPKIRRLVLIPDGVLNYLPFEVLISQPLGKEKASFAKLPYLLHQYAHNYQYSARLWLQMSARKPQTIARILGFAAYYPNQDSLQLAKLTLDAQKIRKNLIPLKGALEEVAHLRSKYAGDYYLEATATEKQLRQSLQSAQKYQILHLAMHGLVNQETPEWSCLGFSPSVDSLEDDLLQAHEIKALQMNQGEGVDMVVLSACETGLGKYQHGEGVISLGRGFVYGGANSLVMSLWSVNDDASAFLMEKFYGHLAAGLEKDAALRQAKLDYLQAARDQDLACHPALWAAFVQLGNIQPIHLQSPQQAWSFFGWFGLGLLGLAAGGFVWIRQLSKRAA